MTSNHQPLNKPTITIVGAGAVGLYAAVRFGELGFRVQVFEAGPIKPEPDYADANTGSNLGVFHKGLRNGRLKAVGGTTHLWGGQLAVFSRSDFGCESYGGKPGWPLSFDQLETHYEAVLKQLGVPLGLNDTIGRWAALSSRTARFGDEFLISPNIWLRQPVFSELLRKRLDELNSVTVHSDHEVLAVHFSDEDGSVSHLTARCKDGTLFDLKVEECILAAGTFENNRILLASAALQPNTALGRNQFLGRFFFDHLHGIGGRVLHADRKALGIIFDSFFLQRHKCNIKIRATDECLAVAKLSNFAISLTSSNSAGNLFRDLRSLAYRVFSNVRPNEVIKSAIDILRTFRLLLPFIWHYIASRRMLSFSGGEISVGIELEQIPIATSMIKLDLNSSDDPRFAKLLLEWRIDGREIQAARKALHLFGAELHKQQLGTLVLDPVLESEDPAAIQLFHDSNHQMGGTRMSNDASNGVVDTNLAVFGTKGLYVAGASVFPSGSFANPTFTSLALTDRLVDFFEARYRNA